MVKEFKEFALKGNVVDMAVGVIIGGAFGKIVDSMIGDLIMPLIAKVIGTVDFSSLFINMSNDTVYKSLDEAKKAGANVFAYGNFITIAVNFLILAFVIFMMVKQMNRIKREEAPPPPPPPGPSDEVKLLGEIRDLLKK
ncbi:MAG: large conductance mechanosensitive channel protein MscL [Acidobacteria bacterium]|nr:large conductance mechanosensitive channel protein MscL [Acidobacteriota bacterium]